jgi:hypothetical protein
MSGDEDLFRKDVKLELSKFRAKTKPTLAEAIALRIERVEAEKRKESDRLKKIDLRLATLTADCAKVAAASCAVIKQNLKKYEFDKKDPRGLSQVVRRHRRQGIRRRRPRSDLKLMGNLSLEKGEASLFLKGKPDAEQVPADAGSSRTCSAAQTLVRPGDCRLPMQAHRSAPLLD